LPTGATKSQGNPNTYEGSSQKGKDPTSVKSSAQSVTIGPAVHSFSTDASPEFQDHINNFVDDARRRLLASLGSGAVAGDKPLPAFAVQRVGDTVHIHFPQHIKSGDILAELIGLLSSQVPSVIIHQGMAGWAEPTWTRDQTLRLFGIVAALQGVPESFATTSSPLDIMRCAVWLKACQVALSVPGGVRDAIAAPLPASVGGEKTASKYILKTLQGLKAGQTDEHILEAIKALDILLSLWIKNQHANALALIRKHKISWGTVLNAGAPTVQKKVKGQTITNVITPLKPSRSPWVSKAESMALGKLYSDHWDHLEPIRKKWNSLTAEAQHKVYRNCVDEVTLHFEQLKKMSTSVHARLGHRKKWIYNSVKRAGNEPRSKKEKQNPYAWTAQFFKLELYSAGLAVALTFSPHHYLQGSFETDQDLDRAWANAVSNLETITPLAFEQVKDENVKTLWSEWAKRFAPEPKEILSRIPDSSGLSDDNSYAALPRLDGEESETETDN